MTSRITFLVKEICCDPELMHPRCRRAWTALRITWWNVPTCMRRIRSWGRSVLSQVDSEQWKVLREEEKNQVNATDDMATDYFRNQMEFYLRQQYNYTCQHEEMRFLKDQLNNDTAIIQVDFSENYSNKQCIQSAYFGQESFSLETVVAWYMLEGENKWKSCCIVTD